MEELTNKIAIAIQANLSNGDEVTRLFEATQQHFSAPDIVLESCFYVL